MSAPADIESSRDMRPAVEKALSLLEAIAETETAGVSALARRAGLAKSTAFRLLAAFERRQVVERTGTEYRVGPMIRRLNDPVIAPIDEMVRDRLTPYLAELFAQTRATVHLSVLSGNDIVVLNKIAGRDGAMVPTRIGGRLPAGATASGKVLLAWPARGLDAALDTPPAALTERTIVCPEEMTAALAEVRREGFARDTGECWSHVGCLAAPVIGAGRRAIAALSITGPRHVVDAPHLIAALRRAAHAASLGVGFERSVRPEIDVRSIA